MKRTLLFVFVISTQFLSSCQKAPEEIVTKFYLSLESGEISAAKECLSKQIISQLGDNKLTTALAQESKKIGACGGIKDIKTSLEGQGEIRTGTVTIIYLGECPENSNDKVSLIQEDGQWKITMSK